MSKRKLVELVGKTTDGKRVVRGAFRLTDERGISLTDVLLSFDRNNLVPDWPHFIQRVYIGSAVDFKKRWREHTYALTNGTHFNNHLQNSWNVYGKYNFLFEVLEITTKENLYVKEQEYLDKHKPFSDANIYNICENVGVGQIGKKQSHVW